MVDRINQQANTKQDIGDWPNNRKYLGPGQDGICTQVPGQKGSREIEDVKNQG